ncbi:FMN-dependent NADH-azoreductase 2 [Geomonas sp. Red276]
MANLLYVTCFLKPIHRSRCHSLGYEFLEEYLRWNPRDEVHVLDLHRDNIPRIDQDVLHAWERITAGESCGVLSEDERRKISRIWRLADQFIACDKYVFVTPSWNLFFPAEFKMYIDAVTVPEKSYRLTQERAEGLLAGELKKSLHIHASAPFSYGNERDLSAPYLRSVLNFLGVTNQEAVLLSGCDDPQQGPSSEHGDARRRLLDLALRF